MKMTSILPVLFFLVVSAAQAQSKDESAVAATVEALRKGMLEGDRALLDKIAASELTYGHSSGLIEDKAAFVEALASGKSDFTKIELANQTIHIAGHNALVRHELTGEVNGGPVKLGVLLVFQKQKNEWKLLARQAFKM